MFSLPAPCGCQESFVFFSLVYNSHLCLCYHVAILSQVFMSSHDILLSVCMSLHPFCFSYKDISHIRLRAHFTLPCLSLYLNYMLKDPISIQGHIHKY